MTTPQQPGKRRKQKIRRTKQLEAWRAKKAESVAKTAKPAVAKPAAAKPAAKKA